MKLNKDISPYQLVHDVAKLAKEMEEEYRYPTTEKKNSIYKEVNKVKKKQNYVLEAYKQITETKAADK